MADLEPGSYLNLNLWGDRTIFNAFVLPWSQLCLGFFGEEAPSVQTPGELQCNCSYFLLTVMF